MPTTAPSADADGPFPAFGAGHLVVVAILVFATAAACAAGIRFRGSAGLRRAEQVAGWLMLGIYVTATVYWLLPANFRLDVSLPIHMCDMTGLLAPLVLLFDRRILRTLLYFWGLGLSIHGVATPVMDHGPEHVTFWLYWLVHSSIIGTAVYDVVARKYRPTFRDGLLATGACAIWLGVVLTVNLPLGLNYGYVGNITPEKPTVIDSLGPWPLRVYKMTFAVIALFVGMWLPWAIVSRRTGSGRSEPSAGAGR